MAVDENGGNNTGLRQAFDGLNARERRFLDQVLRGETHENAALSAGFRSRLAAQDLLGRPRVARALQRAASYLPPAQAYAALRPLLTAQLVSQALAGGAAGISASRDLASMAKGEDKAKDVAAEWAKRRAARKLAGQGIADASRAVAKGEGPEVGITVRDPEGFDS